MGGAGRGDTEAGEDAVGQGQTGVKLTFEPVGESMSNKVAIMNAEENDPNYGKYLTQWITGQTQWSSAIQDYEKFEVEMEADGKIAIKNHHGRYMKAYPSSDGSHIGHTD